MEQNKFATHAPVHDADLLESPKSLSSNYDWDDDDDLDDDDDDDADDD